MERILLAPPCRRAGNCVPMRRGANITSTTTHVRAIGRSRFEDVHQSQISKQGRIPVSNRIRCLILGAHLLPQCGIYPGLNLVQPYFCPGRLNRGFQGFCLESGRQKCCRMLGRPGGTHCAHAPSSPPTFSFGKVLTILHRFGRTAGGRLRRAPRRACPIRPAQKHPHRRAISRPVSAPARTLLPATTA